MLPFQARGQFSSSRLAQASGSRQSEFAAAALVVDLLRCRLAPCDNAFGLVCIFDLLAFGLTSGESACPSGINLDGKVYLLGADFWLAPHTMWLSQGTLVFIVHNPEAPIHEWRITRSRINKHHNLHWYSGIARQGYVHY